MPYDISSGKPVPYKVTHGLIVTCAIWKCGSPGCNNIISSNDGPGVPEIICDSCGETMLQEQR